MTVCAGAEGRLPSSRISNLLTSVLNAKNIEKTEQWFRKANAQKRIIDSGGFQILEAELNNNKYWISLNFQLPNLKVSTLLTIGNNNLIAGTDSSGMFLTTDIGNTWQTINNGIPPNLDILTLVNDKNYVYAGTTSGIFKAKISDFGILDVIEEIKSNEIELFPNPVENQLSIISQNLIEKNYKISDLLGINYFNGIIENNKFELDVSSLLSGIYILKIDNISKIFVKE